MLSVLYYICLLEVCCCVIPYSTLKMQPFEGARLIAPLRVVRSVGRQGRDQSGPFERSRSIVIPLQSDQSE
jgi:hypothetical protein